MMTLAGTSLFGSTVVGLLAVQGRLNFDGTRGVPMLESFFAEPAETEDSDVTPAGEEHPRLEGLGREPVLPRELGPSLDGAKIPAGGQPAIDPEAHDQLRALCVSVDRDMRFDCVSDRSRMRGIRRRTVRGRLLHRQMRSLHALT